VVFVDPLGNRDESALLNAGSLTAEQLYTSLLRGDPGRVNPGKRHNASPVTHRKEPFRAQKPRRRTVTARNIMIPINK